MRERGRLGTLRRIGCAKMRACKKQIQVDASETGGIPSSQLLEASSSKRRRRTPCCRLLLLAHNLPRVVQRRPFKLPRHSSSRTQRLGSLQHRFRRGLARKADGAVPSAGAGVLRDGVEGGTEFQGRVPQDGGVEAEAGGQGGEGRRVAVEAEGEVAAVGAARGG